MNAPPACSRRARTAGPPPRKPRRSKEISRGGTSNSRLSSPLKRIASRCWPGPRSWATRRQWLRVQLDLDGVQHSGPALASIQADFDEHAEVAAHEKWPAQARPIADEGLPQRLPGWTLADHGALYWAWLLFDRNDFGVEEACVGVHHRLLGHDRGRHLRAHGRRESLAAVRGDFPAQHGREC